MPSPFWTPASTSLAVFGGFWFLTDKATRVILNKPLEQVLQENGKEAVEEISNIIRYYKMKIELNQRNELENLRILFLY